MAMEMQRECLVAIVDDLTPVSERENLLAVTAQLKQVLKEAIAALS